MSKYVDGFVLVVPKGKADECKSDDLKQQEMGLDKSVLLAKWLVRKTETMCGAKWHTAVLKWLLKLERLNLSKLLGRLGIKKPVRIGACKNH